MNLSLLVIHMSGIIHRVTFAFGFFYLACFGDLDAATWCQHIGHLPPWGVHISVSYLFAFSYCSWISQGKNTEVVCNCLLQWTTFCQNSPS